MAVLRGTEIKEGEGMADMEADRWQMGPNP